MVNLNNLRKIQGFQTLFDGVFIVVFTAFWLHFILAITPGNYYSADDVNFFAPLASEYLKTNDQSFWIKAQGPHLHIFYKFQTVISMKYFGWSTYFTEILGLFCLIAFGWVIRHKNFNNNIYLNPELIQFRSEKYYRALLMVFCNLVFLTVLLGYVNKRSFEYHMLALNNPTLLVLGAICLYSFAKVLTVSKSLKSPPFLIFNISSFLMIWVLATAFNYFFLLAIGVMFALKIGPVALKSLLVYFKHDRNHRTLVAPIIEYKAAILAVLYFSTLTFVYYLVASGSGVTGAKGSFALSLKFFLNLAYSSTGLNSFAGFQQTPLISYSALILAILVIFLILFSKRLETIDKLFFIGVITFVLSFAVGSVWLRGAGVVLAPRYIFSFSFFWMAAAWLLGKMLFSDFTVQNNAKAVFVLKGEKIAILLIMLVMLFVSVAGMMKTSESVKFLKAYYQARIHTALYTPLDEVSEPDLKAAIFCNLPMSQCKTQILRMRCFANSLGGEFCTIGTQDELIKALDKL